MYDMAWTALKLENGKMTSIIKLTPLVKRLAAFKLDRLRNTATPILGH